MNGLEASRHRLDRHTALEVVKYLDGELDSVRLQRVNEQIQGCSVCQELVRDLEHNALQLHELGRDSCPVPAYLDRRVVRGTQGRARVLPWSRAWSKSGELTHVAGATALAMLDFADRSGRLLFGPCSPSNGSSQDDYRAPVAGFSWLDGWQSGLSVLLARSTRELSVRLVV
jgi:anti-sigma factor RsiW